MRVMFGLPGLVLTLFVVIKLVKIQTPAPAPAPVWPPVAAPSDRELPALQGNSKQVQGQHQRVLNSALKVVRQRLETAQKP
jgi:hypothetical protein